MGVCGHDFVPNLNRGSGQRGVLPAVVFRPKKKRKIRNNKFLIGVFLHSFFPKMNNFFN